LKISQQAAQVEQTPTWLQFHKKIHIACRACLTSRLGAENTHLGRAMSRCDGQDCFSARQQFLVQVHGVIASAEFANG
jgi:hypothetical protein